MYHKNQIQLFFIFILLCVCNQTSLAWDFAEHRKIGDRAMSLLPRYLVEIGVFTNELSADSVLMRIMNMSHLPHSQAYRMNELSQAPNVVTYGTLCGLAGDHASNPMLLETELQTHFSKLNRTLDIETKAMNHFLTGASSKERLSINLAYGLLAIKDLSHFYAYGKDLNSHLKLIDPELIRRLQQPSEVNAVFEKLHRLPSVSKYLSIHLFAVYLAQEAGKEMYSGNREAADNLMYYATLYEAFAEHFLQDSFASGHQLVRRGFSASAICSNKSLHDFYNTIPVKTANMKGEVWSAFGDKLLNHNQMGYNQESDYRNLRVTHRRIHTLDNGDHYERESQVFYQIVTTTCESMGEIWMAYHKACNGSEENILEKMPDERNEMPQFVYNHCPIVKGFPIPFGTHLDDIPLDDSISIHQKEELQRIVQEPFTRNFIRSRVANSLMFLIGSGMNGHQKGAVMYGGRLNISMINWHKFGKGTGMMMSAGDIAQWISPTISGQYTHTNASSNVTKKWNVKGGINYYMDIFVAPKRFLGLYSYLEMGVDHQMNQSRFLIAPSAGVQLGSLIGLHNFDMPGWLRIPLGIILPLKFTVSCNKAAGRPVEWVSNVEVDILF